MSLPKICSAFRRTTGALPNTIEPYREELWTEIGTHKVIIKIRAVSLNYRDVAMLCGEYPMSPKNGGIPCSDASAEVISIGSAVKTFKVGDRVALITTSGKYEDTDDGISEGPGVNVHGFFPEYAIFQEKHLVHLPEGVSWEEASVLPCAGVAAWNALDGLKYIPRRATALLKGSSPRPFPSRIPADTRLGTDGVSMIVLLLCLAAGIRPIITSSSDEKPKALQNLHPEVCGISYKITSDQGDEIKRLTDGRGIDFVINDSGPQSILEDIGFLRACGGTISLVGCLEGFDTDWDPKRLMRLIAKLAKLKGVIMGSKADFEDMDRFLKEEEVKLSLALDRVFPFCASKNAFNYLKSGKHTGKVGIKME